MTIPPRPYSVGQRLRISRPGQAPITVEVIAVHPNEECRPDWPCQTERQYVEYRGPGRVHGTFFVGRRDAPQVEAL